MRLHDDPTAVTIDEQLHEVAAILAAGLGRVRDRAAASAAALTLHPLPLGEGRCESGPENPGKASDSALDLAAKAVLSVPTG